MHVGRGVCARIWVPGFGRVLPGLCVGLSRSDCVNGGVQVSWSCTSWYKFSTSFLLYIRVCVWGGDLVLCKGGDSASRDACVPRLYLLGEERESAPSPHSSAWGRKILLPFQLECAPRKVIPPSSSLGAFSCKWKVSSTRGLLAGREGFAGLPFLICGGGGGEP